MNSYGLDTSVVLRLLVGSPPSQAKTAMDFVMECLQNHITVYVSDMVVLETWHALRHHYNVPTVEAADALFDFLSFPAITSTGHAVSMLKDYNGTGAGIPDRLIRKDYRDDADVVATFDKKFAGLADMKKL
jgi:predicted nucleic acid-binding protein